MQIDRKRFLYKFKTGFFYSIYRFRYIWTPPPGKSNVKTIRITLFSISLNFRNTDCYVFGQGHLYQGQIHVTTKGDECQVWSAISLGGISLYGNSPDHFVDGEAGWNSNFCRLPLDDIAEDTPWCHTADGEDDWGHCDIPVCGKGTSGNQLIKIRHRRPPSYYVLKRWREKDSWGTGKKRDLLENVSSQSCKHI